MVISQRRSDLQVRFGGDYRKRHRDDPRPEDADPQGRMIPLEDLADITREDGIYEIWRNCQRRAMVQANVRGRRSSPFVAEAQRRVASDVQPAGLLPE